MAIPHNGNLSNGLTFNGKTFKGKKITRGYAERRARWEPLFGMSQMKGDEEAHPTLSTEDEFADFETSDVSNLDRVQVIKGWLDDKGETNERIYDIAVSDGRVVGADGRAKQSVGSSVNIEKATYTNTIGDALLMAHWTDPDFDPKESAFYYVRVLEIPTPRWTTYDAAFFNIKRPDIVPATVQDRAYTSPIWYTP
jgi:hypothetical protein